MPDWYTSLVYDRPGAGAPFNEPIGPQPEQVRLLTYLALGAGCHGLGFSSDRFLADSHYGHGRLLTMALLNQEIQLLEPLLLTAEEPEWLDTENPEVKAAVMRTKRGVLILPVWVGSGAQFVPGQSAARELRIVVPGLPQHLEAWEVSPAEVRKAEKSERVVGGTRITVKDFGLTTAIVCTADNVGENSLLVQLQRRTLTMRKIAAQWSYDLALDELDKVIQVHERLQQAGHRPSDSDALLDKARQSLVTAYKLWDREHNYSEVYHESQRACGRCASSCAPTGMMRSANSKPIPPWPVPTP